MLAMWRGEVVCIRELLGGEELGYEGALLLVLASFEVDEGTEGGVDCQA